MAVTILTTASTQIGSVILTTPRTNERSFKNQKMSIMKKFLFAIALLVASTSYASQASIANVKSGDGIHISPTQVPPRILNEFRAGYPTATRIEWEKELEHGRVEYKVSFY